MNRRPWPFRVMAVVLSAGQVLVSVPATALPLPDQAAGQPPPPRRVKVNRTLPRVTPPPLTPRFSVAPTDRELFRARLFPEPLVPIGGPADAAENRVLADALTAFVEDREAGLAALQGFLDAYPRSRWRASLLTNVGLVHQRAGRFTRALAAFEQAWALSRGAADSHGRAVADRAVSELLGFHRRFARQEPLQSLLEEVRDRDLRGSATEKRANAWRALWLMKNSPRDAFRCGPIAIEKILSFGDASYKRDERILKCEATKDGTSLLQIAGLAAELGRKLRMAKRHDVSAAIPVPSVMHWRLRHYSALVKKEGERYLLRDPNLGEFWIDRATLDEESSGYFLVPDGQLPEGWSAVDAKEGGGVWGTCHLAHEGDPDDQSCDDHQVGPGDCGGGAGMPQYSIHTLLVNLRIVDMPVGYVPPVGPPVEFRVTYNDRESFQPQILPYSNLGTKWTFDWLSYVMDDPVQTTTAVYVPGGGVDRHGGGPDHDAQATLVKVSADRYEQRFPDGSVQVFGQPDSQSTPRKFFMTEWRDPQGNALEFIWDSEMRLVAARDALGQVTTVSYGGSDPLRITRVTDPFGRSATFEYNASGQLVRITDVLGLSSSFDYATGDFIAAMTTPYGTTRFTKWDNMSETADGAKIGQRWLEVLDPLGGRERVEYNEAPGYPDTEAAVPTGMDIANSELSFRNTFHWDRRAMAEAPGDYAKATVYHWILTEDFKADGTLSSFKRPLESRVWFNYPGQPVADEQGTINRPSAIGRVLDDGASQVRRFEYNVLGHLMKATDPHGRETLVQYAANGMDVAAVSQANAESPSGHDVLATLTYRPTDPPHLPATVTDASGQTTTLTYNARGQVLTVTNAKDETWTFAYDPTGYLQTVAGPAGASTALTWDGFGRVRTITNADSYTVTLDYDAFDRITRISYPNSSYEEIVYDRLHPSRFRDLSGRWSQLFVDALRRPTAIRDALGRLTTLEWCDCGSLDRLIDARGQATAWERDLQGRVTKETRAESSATSLVYETRTSRLKRLTDAKGQTRDFTYFLDDRLQQLIYGNAAVATPPASFAYDATYGRLLTRTDGTGTTTYAYHPIADPPAVGAGRLASIDGPLENDLVTLGYDELGRVLSRGIGGVTASVVYDSLGRVTGVTNPLGAFSYGYDGATARLLSVSGPNNLRRLYGYFDLAGDRQLREIRNESGSTLLSKFDYTYGPNNDIATWTQQQGTAQARKYEFAYDRADQLSLALLKSTDPAPALLKSYAYTYDPAGNRTTEQVDGVVTTASHDSVNQLTSQQAGGAMRFAGATNEPASVSVQGTAARTTADNRFEGQAAVTAGANTVAVAATDPSGNTSATTYQVTVGGSAGTLAYDANGNLTSDGLRVYTWDTADRLVAIDQGSHRTEMEYDGFSRRTRIVEKDNGVVTSDKHFLWVGTQIAEERNASGTTVTKRFFGQGVQVGSESYYYTKDHLGSIREVMDSSGTVRARYDYDPYGRRTQLAGDLEADFGFTGHYTHQPTGLILAMYRAYDANLGRWLSQDPIGLAGGTNQYVYGTNDPVNQVDRLGLKAYVYHNAATNQVQIQVPFNYPGLENAYLPEWFEGSMEQMWSGTFGKYQVTTCITSGPENTLHYEHGHQNVWAAAPDGSNPHDAISWGTVPYHGSTGKEIRGKDYAWTLGHELGHVMGLDDGYYLDGPNSGKPMPGETDIMSGWKRPIEERTIERILKTRRNDSRKAPLCKK